MTKNLFKKSGIEYTEKNIDEDFDALAEIQLMGLSSVPVVVHDTMVWGGFQPDKIEQVIAYEKGRE